MIHINDTTKIIGTTELRDEMPMITKDLKTMTMIVVKRGKPVAILEDYEKHKQKEKFLEDFEDIVLGYIAKDRDRKSKKDDYVSIEKLMKKLKKRR